MRVTDAMVEHWLVWARNFGEVVAYSTGRGPYVRRSGPRRFRIRLTPGITANGDPFRPKQGILDILGHTEEDVVPAELMLTAREALVFGMGCAAGRAAALMGREAEWQRDREAAWTPAEREAFAARREQAREANRADLDRERDEWDAERQRRVDAHRRRKAGGPQALEGGS